MALAYFGLPGLPEHLEDVRLEYFADAIRWFAYRNELDASSMVALGVSRGSEAAQLVAAHFPELVHHVVAVVPSNIVMGAWPPPTKGAAWVLGGDPIPYADRFGPDTERPESVIPVERIVGRMLVIGAGGDTVWPSPAMASAIAERRGGRRRDDTMIVLPDAGHRIALTRPAHADRSMPCVVDHLDPFMASIAGRGTARPSGRGR